MTEEQNVETHDLEWLGSGRHSESSSRRRRRTGRAARRRIARSALGLTLGLGSVIAVSSPAAALCPAGEQCTSLPDVDMSLVLLASSLDPWRTDLVETHSAGPSVKRVERALAAKGFLNSSLVDGYWGQATAVAWGKFERSIGQRRVYSRNGLPSLYELKTLGKNRFDVRNIVDVGERVQLKSVADGGNSDDGNDQVNERTKAMFLKAQRNMKRADKVGWDMVIIQGGYCAATCAAASAGTHSGGGAIDIRTWDTNATGRANRLTALRKVGFAAWYRGWEGNEHIHAVAINDYHLTWAAHGDGLPPGPIIGNYTGNCQIYEWKFKKDGLGGCNDRVPSNTRPRRSLITWERYLASQ